MSCTNVHCHCPCSHLMKSHRLLRSLCLSGRSGKKMAALASNWLRHFPLLLWNRWTELNETWQDARSQRPLPSLCFSGRSEEQDGRTDLWLAETSSTSPLNEIQGNLTESKISISSSRSLCVSGRSENQDDRTGLRLAETFSTSPLKPLNGIKRNLTGSKNLTSSTMFVLFFRVAKKEDVHHWLAETFSHSSQKLLNGIHRNLAGIKILMPLPSLCLDRLEKQDGRPDL